MTPPAAPKLHPKRCETCTDEDCPFEEERWGSTWHNDIYYFMRKRGCASHSSTPDADARQRIEDVLTTLWNELMWLDGHGYDDDIPLVALHDVQALVEKQQKAIALLKDGGGKK